MANTSTLITRFYGMYSIKPSVGSNVRLIVMNNVFDTNLQIHERYDLKGSTDGRTASEKERQRETPVFKDLDFLNAKRRIKVGPEMKKKIMEQLKSDCAFLEKMKIMDYSLLLVCLMGVFSFVLGCEKTIAWWQGATQYSWIQIPSQQITKDHNNYRNYNNNNDDNNTKLRKDNTIFLLRFHHKPCK